MKFKVVLPTLLVAVLLFGYDFVTAIASLYVDDLESSRTVSFPYRGATFLACLLVLFVNLSNKVRINRDVAVIFVYEALLLLRFFIDFYCRADLFVDTAIRFRILMYLIPMAIIPMMTIVKCHMRIDTNKLLVFSYIFLAVSIFITYYNNDFFQTSDYERRESAFGIGTIGTGHLGLSGLLLSAYMIRNKKFNSLLKLGYFFIFVLSALIMLRSGSRGPLLSFIAVIAVVYVARTRRWLISALLIVLGYIFIDYIIDFVMRFIQDVSPYLYDRIENKQEEGQFMTRLPFYQAAWGEFLKNPLLGSSFAIILPTGECAYAHNVFLDSLMQWGVIGGILILYIYIKGVYHVIALLRNRDELSWLGLLLIQNMTGLLVSSSFCYSPVIPIICVLLFMRHIETKNKIGYKLRSHEV